LNGKVVIMPTYVDVVLGFSTKGGGNHELST
jgi:hypothetical protein